MSWFAKKIFMPTRFFIIWLETSWSASPCWLRTVSQLTCIWSLLLLFCFWRVCACVGAGERAEGLQPAALLQDLHDGQATSEHRRAEGHDRVLHWSHHQDRGDVPGAGNSALCRTHFDKHDDGPSLENNNVYFVFVFPEKYSQDSIWRRHHQQRCLSGEFLQVKLNWYLYNSTEVHCCHPRKKKYGSVSRFYVIIFTL